MMTIDKKLIPTLRFPQFSGEWEMKRIRDIFKINAGGDIKNYQVSNIRNDTFCYPIYANSSQNKGLYGYSNEYKFEDKITIAGRGVGIGLTEYRSEKFYPIVRLLVLDKKVTLSYLFFTYVFNQLRIVPESTGVPQLTAPQLGTYKISLPTTLPEQEKIASFLSSIDRKVELLKAKKEQLEQYKKGVMQQLFAQTIRFKDQSGNQFPEWQEKRLGEIMYKDKLVKCDKININEILTVRLHQKGVVVSSNGKNLSIGATTYYHRYKGQFIYGKQNIFNGAFGFVPSEFDNYLSSADIPALSVKVKLLNVNFFVYMMANNGNYRRIENLAIGTGSKRVHEQDLLKIKINLPSLPEQEKIADFLSAIDRKIEGVGQQMAQTELFKKAMLQQLFV